MKEGYIVFAVSAKPHGYPNHDPLPLDDLDGNGLRLMDIAREAITPYYGRAAPEKRARYQSAYTFRETPSWGDDRLFISGESGPYGRRGRLKDVNGGAEHPINANDAALLPQCAGLVAPAGARAGLLFCERRGVSTLRTEIEEAVLTPAGRAHKIKLDIAGHVDFEEWERFLEHARVASIRAVYQSRRREDYLPEISRASDLTLAAGGGLAHRAGMALMREALSAVRHRASPRPDAVLIQDLRPADPEDYSAPQISIEASDGQVHRSIRFTETGVPQWVYETGERLTEAQMRDTWSVAAPSLLRPYLAG